MSYDELWAWFNRASNEIKYAIWVQLDLDGWLPTASQRVKDEVLKFAPAFVFSRYNHPVSQEPKIKKVTQSQLERRLRKALQ